MDPKHIVRDGYDKVSRVYRDDAGRGPFEMHDYRPWLEGLLERVRPGGPVLELGCGCGLPAGEILTRRHPYTGIDISPVQIERARQLVAAGTFRCADMTELSYAPSSFAAVLSLYAIIHVPVEEQLALFTQIAWWLEEGGWFLATVGLRANHGTEADWLGVAGATMYWSHADAATYEGWCGQVGLRVHESRLIPEGDGGHQLILAQKAGRQVQPWLAPGAASASPAEPM